MLGSVQTHENILAMLGTPDAVQRLMDEGVRVVTQTAWKNLSPHVLEAVKAPLRRMQGMGKAATDLIQNLSLVMLCTQLEIFIKHLIDVILVGDPRRLKAYASEKNVTAAEVVELGDYGGVMQRFRDKVAKEVTDAGIREMMCRHLGTRFGLIEEIEIRIVLPGEAQGEQFRGWNLEKLVEIFELRNQIVHRGTLPVTDIGFLNRAGHFFQAIQTVLSVNAVLRHDVGLQPPDSLNYLAAMGEFYSVSEGKLAKLKERLNPSPA